MSELESGKEVADEIVGFSDVLQQIGEFMRSSSGAKIDGSGDVAGVIVEIISDINEYGFVWNRDPHTQPRIGSGQMIEVNADTSGPSRASDTVINGWKDSLVPAYAAAPVPIPRPAESWAWSKYDFCDAAGSFDVSVYTDAPYRGAGAQQGQLLYKFGEYGKVLPIYNEGYIKGKDDTGNLFMRLNIPDDEMNNNSGKVKVYIGMVVPQGTPVYVYVGAQNAWLNAGIARRLNWDKKNEVYYGGGLKALMALDAPALPEVRQWYLDPPIINAQGVGTGVCRPSGLSSHIINIEGDSRYPYSGVGARHGQLIYKWGEYGTVLPVWHSEELGEANTGNLFLRMNDEGMSDNHNHIYVLATP